MISNSKGKGFLYNLFVFILRFKKFDKLIDIILDESINIIFKFLS